MGAVLAPVRPEAPAEPAAPPGPRGDENQLTGEPRLLADGKSIYIHTFKCGLYLLRGVERPEPTMTFVRGFQGKDCGVPVLTGHYWLQTVPEAHAVIALDISIPSTRAKSRSSRSARTSSRTGCRSTPRDAAWYSTRAAAARATGSS